MINCEYELPNIISYKNYILCIFNRNISENICIIFDNNIYNVNFDVIYKIKVIPQLDFNFNYKFYNEFGINFISV